jgi:RNA polymerase sigma-70 factor (ECF subfamily)
MSDLATFQRHRPRLLALAYRMLGRVSEAEDVLQDAFLRWHQARTEAVADAEAWLVTVVTRLCIDRLRSAKASREAYVGPWLPEPWPGADPAPTPDQALELASDLSTASLLLLERLAPLERAVFLLHDVFGLGHAVIAGALARTEAACRQILHRARERLQGPARHPAPPLAEQEALLRRFLSAAEAGDEAELLEILAPEAVYVTDGGGRTRAALNAILGRARILRLLVGLQKKSRLARADYRPALLNGQPGAIAWEVGKPVQALTLEVVAGRIAGIYLVLNPEKLAHLAGTAFPGAAPVTPEVPASSLY